MLPWPVREPSPVQIQIVQMLIAELQNIASSYDLSEVIGPNTPAASVLAMIMKEESSHGAILDGVYDSMAEEFNNIKMIMIVVIPNGKYRNIADDNLSLIHISEPTRPY